MKDRIISLLNLRQTESRYVFDLLRIQFFIGIANAFINITAFTYFIYDYSIGGLPYAYLVIAVALLFLNRAYQKIELKLSPLHLLRFLILISTGILLLFWSGLLIWDKHALIFLLFVWSVVFYMVTGYAYWGLVSLVFNVRESRRVFSIVGSGDIPTKLIGYLSTPLLIPLIGLQNLLLLSILSLLTGFVLMGRLMKEKSWDAFKKKAHPVHHKKPPKERQVWLFLLFRNKLIFTISLLSILSYNVFNFIDFTFIAQIKLRQQDLAALAAFVATFFGIGRALALVLKLVFTSRLIERLGIISCLLITPAVLFAICLLMLFFPLNYEYTLYAFGIMAALTEVLRSTIQEPVFFVLFQPLNEHQRLEGHIIAKGYMLPPSLIVVGVSLILMKELHVQLSVMLTVKMIMANLAIWAAIIFFIKREYIKVLHSSIARGIFNGEQIHVYDTTTINILLNKVQQGNESEVIYALKLLQGASYHQLDDVLRENLTHPGKEVRKFVLDNLQKREQLSASLLREALEEEKDREVREKLVTMLCRLDPQYLHQVFEHLEEQEYNVRKAVIIHLLNQHEFTYLYQAGSEIHKLIRSPLPAERELALNIIGELDKIKFNDVLHTMIGDEDPTVKRTAIMAACKLRASTLLPLILEIMQEPSERYLAMQGLLQYGDLLFEDLQALPIQQRTMLHADLIKVAGRMKGPHSTKYLFLSLETRPELTDKIIHALWTKGLEVQSVASMHHFHQLMYDFLKRGIEKISYHNDMPHFHSHSLVKSSMAAEIRNDLVTALKICALLYHKKEINRILELVEQEERSKLYNAMEMLELVLPKKISSQINHLMDHILDPHRVKKLPGTNDAAAYFQRVVVTGAEKFNPWTRAVCIYCSLKSGEVSFIRTLEHHATGNDHPIISETKNFVLQTIQLPSYVNH